MIEQAFAFIIPLVCVIVIASMLYWLRYGSGVFASPEQSEYLDGVEKELEGKSQ